MGYSRCSIGSNSLIFFCQGSIIVVLALLKYLKNPKSSYVQSYLFIYIFHTTDLRIENNVNKTLKKEETKSVERRTKRKSKVMSDRPS